MNDYYYNPDDYHQLTAMDKANGWTVKQDKARLTYCQNGQWHDPVSGEPAVRLWHDNGQLSYEGYYQNGQRHDPDSSEPAARYWHDNGQLWYESYHQNGQWHDPPTGEPAYRSWHDNGQLSYETYHQNGQLHDPPTGEPAYRSWHDNGQLRYEFYYQNSQLHNPTSDKPARRHWHDNGQLRNEGHYCRGVGAPAAFWSWTVDDALACENTEQRRVWFEGNGGWETFEQDFSLVDEQPDPANCDHTLRLCDFPQKLDVYGGDARIVFCDNASLDLDGTRRRYGLIFPKAWGDDALVVIARSFGLSRGEYASLGVAK